MNEALLRQMLFIGGGTDAGKTSVARVLAQQYGAAVYHYDGSDLTHHQHLALTSERYATFLNASHDDRWMNVTPEHLFHRAVQTFKDRFPLFLDDLRPLWVPKGSFLIAEGFGFLPELLAPLGVQPAQVIYLLPTLEFKEASMTRRNKGWFGGQVSDPQQARANVLARDLRLNELMRTQANAYGFTLLTIDGTRTPEEVAQQLNLHFQPFLTQGNAPSILHP